MHLQEEPGYFTRYSEADYSVYDRVIVVRLPAGVKDSSPLHSIYTHPGLALSALYSAENLPGPEYNYSLSFRSEV
jgi:hypothetical protein